MILFYNLINTILFLIYNIELSHLPSIFTLMPMLDVTLTTHCGMYMPCASACACLCNTIKPIDDSMYVEVFVTIALIININIYIFYIYTYEYV